MADIRPVDIDGIVFDLDGVIYRDDEPMPHARETVGWVRSRSKKSLFFSNNSTRNRDAYVMKLGGFGISAALDEIMSSAYATALYVLDHDIPHRCAYVIGEEGIKQELEQIGCQIADDAHPPDQIDLVVIGMDRQLTYQKLRCGFAAIQKGAHFLATNRDPVFPAAGRLVPGAGSLVAALETAAGFPPILIGKPETYALTKLLELHGVAPGRALVVGDQPKTDMLSGRRAGTHTALVLTGVTREEEARQLTGDMIPDFILRDLSELSGIIHAC